MATFAPAVFALLAALLISFLVNPLIRSIAHMVGFVDRPDGRRKVQRKAVALGGGISCLIAVAATIIVFTLPPFEPEFFTRASGPTQYIGLILAALVIVSIGVFDDYRGLRGSFKLLWQVVAASILIGSGLVAHTFFDHHLPAIGTAFTLLWLLGTMNSFNLIDGVDGLAGSVGVVFSLTFGMIALLGHQPPDAVIAFALAGALLGFLRYNISKPSTIYLGDAGSMLIGLILGFLAIRCQLKRSAILTYAVPLTVWAIPIFDSAAAVLRRKLTGRSIYATDRGHIHHVLLTRGMSARQAVLVITGLCAVTSAAAFIGWYAKKEWISILVVAIVIGCLVATRVFGHVEFVLLNRRLLGVGHYLAPFGSRGAHKASYQLQGNYEWELMWNALVEATDRFDLVKMRLNLSVPQLHENFFATWRSDKQAVKDQLWQLEVPFVVEGRPIGTLSVSGQQTEEGASARIGEFLDFVEQFESQLQSLIAFEQSRNPAKVDVPEEDQQLAPDSVAASS